VALVFLLLWGSEVIELAAERLRSAERRGSGKGEGFFERLRWEGISMWRKGTAWERNGREEEQAEAGESRSEGVASAGVRGVKRWRLLLREVSVWRGVVWVGFEVIGVQVEEEEGEREGTVEGAEREDRRSFVILGLIEEAVLNVWRLMGE
jgi:hypothetical protein